MIPTLVVGDPKAAVSVSLSLGLPSGRSTNPGRPGLANPIHFLQQIWSHLQQHTHLTMYHNSNNGGGNGAFGYGSYGHGSSGGGYGGYGENGGHYQGR